MAAPSLESRINSIKGNGLPLNSAIRAFFEPRFGCDFSEVRVHTDSNSAGVAKSINARAFTIGNHVVMGPGEDQLTSRKGQLLLGHELTHVVQQKAGNSPKIQRYTCENDPATVPGFGMAGCSTETSRPAHFDEDVSFGKDINVLVSTEKAALSTVVARWHADARNDTVRIDGFSSCDGGAAQNWRLSCDRARAIETEMKNPKRWNTWNSCHGYG